MSLSVCVCSPGILQVTRQSADPCRMHCQLERQPAAHWLAVCM